MALVTLQVLDGADRGRVYDGLPTPVTIGREEGNTVQLNDERISRYHVKIQEDGDRVILTDLESTNGTRVNGEDVQLRVLRYGDVISLGRSVLRYGTREQIANRLQQLRQIGVRETERFDPDELTEQLDAASLEYELSWGLNEELQSALHMPFPPDLPGGLTAGQAAQISEVLEYIHTRLRQLIASVRTGQDLQEIVVPVRRWQALIDLQACLSEYLRQIGEPGESE